MTVEYAFYPGCTAHSTGLEYSLSLHAVADALGIKLREIDDWKCCGGAAARSVSNLLGLALPARNIAKAQSRDLSLAIPCPGCFNATKRAQNALSSEHSGRVHATRPSRIVQQRAAKDASSSMHRVESGGNSASSREMMVWRLAAGCRRSAPLRR